MIVLDGSSLTVDEISRAATGDEPVELTAGARDATAHTHERALAITRPVYGRTTGVGGNRLIPLEDSDTDLSGAFDPALALLRSHASSSGELRSRERVRAMLVVRLNQLAAGGSGVNPAVLDGLLDMIGHDALPSVRELGGVGTGDLPALATTALTLVGEIPASRGLTRVVPIGIGDALPLLSSNAATIGDAALALRRLQSLARAAVRVAAATFVAAGGNHEAFSVAVENVTPFDGARSVCQTMRALTTSAAPGRRIQDPFALRAMPQVHGPLLDALIALEHVVTLLANAPTENPTFQLGYDVVHHGGFHIAYLAQALDSARLALAQAAQLSTARISTLCSPDITGLPAFLTDARPGASGVMVVEYVTASALGALRMLATPAGLQTVSLSQGVEEDASFASLAAKLTLDAVAPYRSVLAGELVVALRALRMQGVVPPELAPMIDACSWLGTSVVDRDLTADLLLAEHVLADCVTGDGEFERATEPSAGSGARVATRD